MFRSEAMDSALLRSLLSSTNSGNWLQGPEARSGAPPPAAIDDGEAALLRGFLANVNNSYSDTWLQAPAARSGVAAPGTSDVGGDAVEAALRGLLIGPSNCNSDSWIQPPAARSGVPPPRTGGGSGAIEGGSSSHSNSDDDIKTKLEEWKKGYTEWVHTLDWDSILGSSLGAGMARPPVRHVYPGGPPPIPMGGDPNARAKIKCADEYLSQYRRIVEMAIDFYNRNHQGSDFEAVEILSANGFYSDGVYHHIYFKGKPKCSDNTKEVKDDAESVRLFFAERWYGSDGPVLELDLLNGGEIKECCMLDQGATKDYCAFCHSQIGLLHPLRGFAGDFYNKDDHADSRNFFHTSSRFV